MCLFQENCFCPLSTARIVLRSIRTIPETSHDPSEDVRLTHDIDRTLGVVHDEHPVDAIVLDHGSDHVSEIATPGKTDDISRRLSSFQFHFAFEFSDGIREERLELRSPESETAEISRTQDVPQCSFIIHHRDPLESEKKKNTKAGGKGHPSMNPAILRRKLQQEECRATHAEPAPRDHSEAIDRLRCFVHGNHSSVRTDLPDRDLHAGREFFSVLPEPFDEEGLCQDSGDPTVPADHRAVPLPPARHVFQGMEQTRVEVCFDPPWTSAHTPDFRGLEAVENLPIVLAEVLLPACIRRPNPSKQYTTYNIA